MGGEFSISYLRFNKDVLYLFISVTIPTASQFFIKTTGGVTTKYVYGNGLIGEETNGVFKTYHFDYRGSTAAITDACGNVTDTFEYDTYGKLTGRTGTSEVIFGYNGRDGVITDDNGLIYMRARYYSPDMKRFINADVVAGDIANAVTLNRYAYANGNPVSYVDPLGLEAERDSDWYSEIKLEINKKKKAIQKAAKEVMEWFEKTGDWMDKKIRNEDGSYALYDNQRTKDSVFHEQVLAFTPAGFSLTPEGGDFGLGTMSVDGYTGGWEGEYVDLSLIDIGHAELSAGIEDGQVSVGALASLWSPSVSITIFGVTVELGLEVGAVGGGFEVGNKGIKVKAAGGIGVSVGITR